MKWFYSARPLVASIICAAVLAGCGTTREGSLRTYDDPNDPCNTTHQPLIATEVDWINPMSSTGAFIIGGVIDAPLIGKNIDVAGYIRAKRKTAQNRQELIATINNDANTDRDWLREFEPSIDELNDCRIDQIQKLTDRVFKGELSYYEIQYKIYDIKESMYKDNQLVEQIIGKLDERFKTYVDAKSEVLGMDWEESVVSATTEDPVVRLGIDIKRGRQTHFQHTFAIEMVLIARISSWEVFAFVNISPRSRDFIISPEGESLLTLHSLVPLDNETSRRLEPPWWMLDNASRPWGPPWPPEVPSPPRDKDKSNMMAH